MLSLDRIVIPLRVLLVLVFAGLVVAQTLSLPGEFSQTAREHPEAGGIPWLILTVAILVIVCFQVVIVCTWRLLGLVRSNRIFSPESFTWVDAIVWSLAVAWLLLAALAAYLVGVIYFTPEIRDPGTPIMLTGLVLIGAVLVLTMVVMRALLRQAAALQSDLEDVI